MALLPVDGAGAQLAFSSPMGAKGSAVMDTNVSRMEQLRQLIRNWSAQRHARDEGFCQERAGDRDAADQKGKGEHLRGRRRLVRTPKS
jgi:hypothetical protein